MGHSQRVRHRDLRDVYRLIGDCQELGADPVAWRKRLLEGLCRLLGDAFGAAGEAWWRGTPRVFDGSWGPVEHGPAKPRGWNDFLDPRSLDETGDNPIYLRLADLQAPFVTIAREQLADDRTWFGSDHGAECRRIAGFDEFIYSAYRVEDTGPVNVVGVHRLTGGKPFSTRDRRLVHILHHELGRLIGSRLATGRRGSAPTDRLSPRMRQTLDCLLQGDSEKQVAGKLGLTRPTVHQYVTALYRHFGVSGRSELMALWVRKELAPTRPTRPHGPG
jgi:DNA-binding CsgD family transcriptional regulator